MRSRTTSVATLSVYTHPSVDNDPVLMAFQAQQTSALPMPTDDRMAASWEPLARAIRRVSRGAHSPSAALAAAQTEFEVETAPPPKPTNPTPYILVALVLVLAGRASSRGKRGRSERDS